MVWIGLLSYSLYLWHWPLFAFNRYFNNNIGTWWPIRLTLVAASFLLAWLSLRFVELPFRSRTVIRTRNHVFALSVGAVTALVLVSVLLWKTHGAKIRLSPEAQRLAAGATDYVFQKGLTAKDIPDHLAQVGVLGLPPKVLIWGDSHAMAILPAVDLACKKAGLSARAATTPATAPVLEWFLPSKYSILNENAPAFNAAVLEYNRIAASQGLSHVILTAHWEMYLNKESSRNEPFQAALRKTVREIQSAGCHVVILIDVPRFSFNPPRVLAKNAFSGKLSNNLVNSSAQHLADTAMQRPILFDLVQHGVTVIDPAEFFTDTNGFIRPADSGGSFYRDNNHLSTHGSYRLTGLFTTILQTGDSK